MADEYEGAIIGVCLATGLTLVVMIVLLVVFCGLRIKEDSNIRKRVISKQTESTEEIVQPILEEVQPIPQPVIYPRPVPVPVPVPAPAPLPLPTPPIRYLPERPQPPAPRFLPPPPAIPAPVPPKPVPAPEPRVIVREIHHHSNQTTTPTPPQRHQRRNSWGGTNNDWVMVKKIKRRMGRKTRSDDSCSDCSCSEDEETVRKSRPRQRPVMPMMPRLAPYDLAVGGAGGFFAPRQAIYGVATPQVQPQVVMTSQPAVQQPGFVSVMMPRM